MKNLKNIVLLNQEADQTKSFNKNVNESYRKNYSKKDHKEEFGRCIDYKRQKQGLQCKRGGEIRGTLRTMRMQDDAQIIADLGL